MNVRKEKKPRVWKCNVLVWRSNFKPIPQPKQKLIIN